MSTCETNCPKCPENSLRDGKTFTLQIENLPTVCKVDFSEPQTRYIQCNERIEIIKECCTQPVELSICEGTPSEQKVTCLLQLDYFQLNGDLELVFNVTALCESICFDEPDQVTFHATALIPVEELCYYCEGTRPQLDKDELCSLFEIQIVSIDADGLITFTVIFNGCPEPI